jgi:hypothetical protein
MSLAGDRAVEQFDGLFIVAFPVPGLFWEVFRKFPGLFFGAGAAGRRQDDKRKQ